MFAGGTASGGAATGGNMGAGGSSIIASYTVTFNSNAGTVGITVVGTSTTPQATCGPDNCRVPAGGAVSLTAPTGSPGFVFTGWSGGAGCSTIANSITLSNITADIACTANYTPVYTVTVTVTGGPIGTTITPTSASPKAICSPGSCQIPSGGSLVAAAPSLTDWYFNGWTGAVTSTSPSVTLSNVLESQSITANYINQRREPCADKPPANAVTSSTPQVTTSYTTAGGWTSPTQCPWTCKSDYCLVANACVPQYVDVLSYTGGTSAFSYGYDVGLASYLGEGQGVTSASKVTIDRFGFNFRTGFTSTSGEPITNPSQVQLDQRDANGQILASFTKALDTGFGGGWVFWDTPSTSLNANILYIFTSFLATADTQRANASIAGDTTVPSVAGGSYYYAIQTSTSDLTSWSFWSTSGAVLQFRAQQRNSACK